MNRPRLISPERFHQLFNNLRQRGETLALINGGCYTDYFASSPVPCGADVCLRKKMVKLNPDNRYTIYHLINISCRTIPTIHYPTMTECLVHDTVEELYYYHKHPVGECWFKTYPKED